MRCPASSTHVLPSTDYDMMQCPASSTHVLSSTDYDAAYRFHASRVPPPTAIRIPVGLCPPYMLHTKVHRTLLTHTEASHHAAKARLPVCSLTITFLRLHTNATGPMYCILRHRSCSVLQAMKKCARFAFSFVRLFFIASGTWYHEKRMIAQCTIIPE